MNPKLEEVFQGLLAGTQTGAFQWGQTPEPGVYRLMLDKGLVCVYRFGPDAVGGTVLGARGIVLHDVQVPRRERGTLVQLYDLVEANNQEGALDDLLAEVRIKMQESGRRVPAGQK
jgi:hypothetical protein